MMTGHVAINLKTEDLEKSLAFYQALGFRTIDGGHRNGGFPDREGKKWRVLQSDGVVIGLFEGMLESNHLSFYSDRLDEIRTLFDNQSIDYEEAMGSLALVDPDGLPLLFEPVHVNPEEELMEADRAFCDAVQEGGGSAFAEGFDEHGIMVSGRENRLIGRELIRAAMRRFFDKPGFQLIWEPLEAQVSVDGTLGHTSGTYERSYEIPSGEKIIEKGSYSTTWKRDETGDWRVLFDIGN